jgi:hypothetical protein
LQSIGVLSDYDINIYLDDLLAPQTRLCTKLSKEKIMSFTNSEISKPLSKILNPIFNDTAVCMFDRKN